MTSSSAPAATDITLQQGLHQDGRRLTPQRKRVLELFERCGSGCHLSAEEVHQQLAAPGFGCTGAHQMGEMWMVCDQHGDADHQGAH